MNLGFWASGRAEDLIFSAFSAGDDKPNISRAVIFGMISPVGLTMILLRRDVDFSLCHAGLFFLPEN